MGDELVYREGMRWLRDLAFYSKILRYTNPRPGQYWPGLDAGGAWERFAPPANLLVASVYPVPRRMRFDEVCFRVVDAGASGAVVRLGLYGDNGSFYPGELIADFGEFDVSTAGFKCASIDLTLDKGVYWIAYINNDGSATYAVPRVTFYPVLGVQDDIYAVVYCRRGYEVSHSYGPLPSTFPEGAKPSSWTLMAKLRIAEVYE